jgi:hypothetical protein
MTKSSSKVGNLLTGQISHEKIYYGLFVLLSYRKANSKRVRLYARPNFPGFDRGSENLIKVSPKRQLPFWSGQLPFWHCELPFSFLLGSYKNRVGQNPGVPKFRWAEIRVGRDSTDIRLVGGLRKEWHLLAYQSPPQAWRKASIGKICRLLGSTHDKENVALISHTF